jgi:predicted house-cleaning noncanonical NTP pyrophosphatase (MazG superfamily)
MTKYGKLVRDRIPDIIRANGTEPVTHTAAPQEYTDKLCAKLDEEVAEFKEAYSPEELADVLEVIYALAEHAGMTREELEALRAGKAEKRGGFSERIILDES